MKYALRRVSFSLPRKCLSPVAGFQPPGKLKHGADFRSSCKIRRTACLRARLGMMPLCLQDATEPRPQGSGHSASGTKRGTCKIPRRCAGEHRSLVGLKPDTTKAPQRYVAPGFIPANPATAGPPQAIFASPSKVPRGLKPAPPELESISFGIQSFSPVI
jgi:hypothetical protein